MRGVIADISDRKKAEESIRHLANIVEDSNDAIIGKDLNGIVTSWNIGAERIYGYKEKEMIGQSIKKIVPVAFWQQVEDFLTKVRAGEVIEHYETKKITKDVEVIDVDLTSSPIKDENEKVIGESQNETG